MKKLEKMSLANVKGKLSRKEMKNIMAGSGEFVCCIAYGSGSAQWSCGYTVSAAQDYYRDGGRGYCCAHC